MKNLIATVLLLGCGLAQAALVERASGAAYYDTVLDITWLADANYAETSGFQSGLLSWHESNDFIAEIKVWHLNRS